MFTTIPISTEPHHLSSPLITSDMLIYASSISRPGALFLLHYSFPIVFETIPRSQPSRDTIIISKLARECQAMLRHPGCQRDGLHTERPTNSVDACSAEFGRAVGKQSRICLRTKTHRTEELDVAYRKSADWLCQLVHFEAFYPSKRYQERQYSRVREHSQKGKVFIEREQHD